MLGQSKMSAGLLLRIVFMTAKSARQTTPNLIQNPRLTKRGILTTVPKSFAYDIREDLPNRHLYWNNTVQNRIRRKQYNSHRLYKLGIKPIHDEKGVPLHNRTVDQVLYQLSNLKLLKQSLGRTLINLREIALTFPQVMKTQDKKIVEWTVNQINDRNLPSLNHYQFSTYCFLRKALNLPATGKMLVQLYKWVQGEVESPTEKIRPKYFLANMKYIFETAPVSQYNDLLYKEEQKFKLFEDITPGNKPIIELLPRLFTAEQIQSLKQDKEFKIDYYNFLMKLPGGKALFDRISQ